MTTAPGGADRSAATDTATDGIESASSRQRNVRQAAGEVARSLPPMTAEQAALVRHALRDQRR